MRRDPARWKHELDVLSGLARSLASTTRLDDLLFEIVRAASEVLDVGDCVLYLWEESSRVLEQRAAWGPKLDPAHRTVINPLRLKLGQGIVGSVAASRLVEIVEDVSIDRRYIEDLEVAGSELAVPILHQDRLVGVLDAESKEKRAFGADEAIVLTRFADLCASSIVLLQRREQESRRIEETLREVEGRLRHLTTHDPLTGLLDRVHFHEELVSALQTCGAGGPRIAVVSLALDRFHAVNRAAGPEAGDELLKRVATVCRERARRSDVTARVAGVGFALLLRGASIEEAVALAQTVRTEIESLPVPAGAPPLAASAGVAAPLDERESADELLRRAERARHAAEDAGGGVASA
jgi:diguanylate cyclase (GGDEF)-like protein